MNILFLVSEIALRPQANAVGLEIALPKALKALGHRVIVLAPYRDTSVGDVPVARRLVALEAEGEAFQVFEAKLNSGVEVVLLRGAQSLADGAPLNRFVEAACAYVEAREEKFDAVHVLGAALESAPRALARGSLQSRIGKIALSTANQQTSDEVARAALVHDVPAGIDYSLWNPALDSHLSQRYDFTDDLSLQRVRAAKTPSITEHHRFGKSINKAALQHALGLPQNNIPLLLVPPSACSESLLEALPTILRQDVQVVCLSWNANASLQAAMNEAQHVWPDRVRFVHEAKPSQETFVRRALAAADILVAPHNDEQVPTLAALKYGALPIVGAYAQKTLVELGHDGRSGTAIFLSHDGAEAMSHAALRAIALFAQKDSAGMDSALRTRLRIMRDDHSWDLRARAYERVYRAKSA